MLNSINCSNRIVRMMRIVCVTMLVFLLLAFVFTPVVEACPTCKAGMEGEEHSGLQKGYYWSIIFMMSMPFIIMSGLSLLFYLSIRRAKTQKLAIDGVYSDVELYQ